MTFKQLNPSFWNEDSHSIATVENLQFRLESTSFIEGIGSTVSMRLRGVSEQFWSPFSIEVTPDNKVWLPSNMSALVINRPLANFSWNQLGKGPISSDKNFVIAALIARDKFLNQEPNILLYEHLVEKTFITTEMNSLPKNDKRRKELEDDIRMTTFLELCEEDLDLKDGWQIACQIAPGSTEKELEDARIFVKSTPSSSIFLRVLIFFLKIVILVLGRCKSPSSSG